MDNIFGTVMRRSYSLNVYTRQNPRRHVVLKNTSQMPTICTQFGRNLSVYLSLHVSFSPGGGIFLQIRFSLVKCPSIITFIPSIRNWLDFYEDDMSPWVLSSIHIQRSYCYHCRRYWKPSGKTADQLLICRDFPVSSEKLPFLHDCCVSFMLPIATWNSFFN